MSRAQDEDVNQDKECLLDSHQVEGLPRPRHTSHGLRVGPKGDDEMKLKLDLHDIYNHGGDIDQALRAIIDEAVRKKAPLVEIIPGKGSGALKKHVLRFLDQKDIKALYHRVEKDSNNFGRVFVHFRWK
jgi:DNA-nicking Smr family endonuclease